MKILHNCTKKIFKIKLNLKKQTLKIENNEHESLAA